MGSTMTRAYLEHVKGKTCCDFHNSLSENEHGDHYDGCVWCEVMREFVVHDMSVSDMDCGAYEGSEWTSKSS